LTKITLFNIIHTQSSIADMLDNFSQAAIKNAARQRTRTRGRTPVTGQLDSGATHLETGATEIYR
jgi:hypothetical protein